MTETEVSPVTIVADTISLVRQYELDHPVLKDKKLGDWEEKLAKSATANPERNLLLKVAGSPPSSIKEDLVSSLSTFQVEINGPVDDAVVKHLPLRFFDHVYIAGMTSTPKEAVKFIVSSVKPLLRQSGSSVSLALPAEPTATDMTILEYIRSEMCLTPAERGEYSKYLQVTSNVNKHLGDVFRGVGFTVRSSGSKSYAIVLELIEQAERSWPSPKTLPLKLLKRLEKENARLLSKISVVSQPGQVAISLQQIKPLGIRTILANQNNSCYMDSILFPLLINPDWKLTRDILAATSIDKKMCKTEIDSTNTGNTVKDELNRLSRILLSVDGGESQSHQTCRRFRKMLKDCSAFERFSTREQMDDSEFLVTLMTLFNVAPTTIENTKTYFKDENDLASGNSGERSSAARTEAIIEINLPNDPSKTPVPDIIEYYERAHIVEADDYLFGDNRDNKYMQEANTIVKTDGYLLFHVNRLVNTESGKRKKIKTPVAIIPFIQGSGSDTYTLSLITVHDGTTQGGHYYCYFKSDGVWYAYDDMDETTPYRVKWEVVVDIASTNCSILMYNSIAN